MTDAEITVEALKSAAFIAKRRFATLAVNATLTPQDVMREMAETVIPQLEDIALLVDRVEQGVMYAQNEIERIDAGDETLESQLLAEDAVKYTDFLEAIASQADESMRGLDASSAEAKAMTLIAHRARELIIFTNDITITDLDDEDEEGEDEEGEGEEGEEGEEKTPTNGNGGEHG